MQVKRRKTTARKGAATNDRNFRTFLLMSQLQGKAIGARIRQARDEAGLTQEQLADMAKGFSKRSLQDYEAGTTIPYKHMQEIAALTGKKPEWIIHGDPEPQPGAAAGTEMILHRLEGLEARVLEMAEMLREKLEIEEGSESERVPGRSQEGETRVGSVGQD